MPIAAYKFGVQSIDIADVASMYSSNDLDCQEYFRFLECDSIAFSPYYNVKSINAGLRFVEGRKCDNTFLKERILFKSLINYQSICYENWSIPLIIVRRSV